MNYFRLYISSFLCIIIISCSSAPYSDRYEHEEQRDRVENNENSQRFTSTNDYKKLFNNEFDEEPREDVKADLKDITDRYSNFTNKSGKLSQKDKILMEVVKYVNTPYLYGGNGKKGIDCSAFTQNVFKNSINLNLPRTAATQFKEGNKIGESSLRFGDLVFFNTRKAAFPGHVGIYIGENLFAHASVSQGVTISSLESSYYKKRFISGRRILK